MASGIASKKILLANALRWGGSHHELGERGLTVLRERCAAEPDTNPDEVHGRCRQHMLEMRLGETDIADGRLMRGF